jgi:hypothetical protein
MGISFSGITPVFTQMQDDNKLDDPSKKMSATEKCICPNLNDHPKIKHVLRQIFYY